MDFISSYLEYVEKTEPPYNYHRWCAISLIAALIGRNSWVPLGHQRIFPNLYLMLMGVPAARKSTAIKIARKMIAETGYDTFAADESSREKFLMDLDGSEDDSGIGSNSKKFGKYDSQLEKNLWGDLGAAAKLPKEVFVVADEFNEFAGEGNISFYRTLGNLWDWDSPIDYAKRLKNSKSISIYQPTINILGGNTQENFIRAFPPEIGGVGFLSRMVFIHGERSERKYFNPPEPTASETGKIISLLNHIKSQNIGCFKFTEAANDIRESIYNNHPEIEDSRFTHYNNRRYTQLMKLSQIISVSRDNHGIIGGPEMIEANTYLSAAEHNMPRALGEFGKSSHGDVTNMIMDILYATHKPVAFKELFGLVYKELDKPQHLTEIMQALLVAGRVQAVDKGKYLPVRKVRKEVEYVDWGLLTEEERKML